jgi:hypothetical protein
MNGRIGSQKSRRRIKVAPVTRAVRIALAASAAAFALVGPGTALAQSCVDDAGTTLCDGAFTDPIGITDMVDDVTLVVGSVDPTTTVTPDPGYSAIFVYAAGDLSITNLASAVYAGYTAAIQASAAGSVDVVNGGSVYAYEGAGIQAYSQDGDVTVANGGEIHAYGYDPSTTAAGIVAYSMTGQASTSNSGNIEASGYDLAGGVVSYAIDGDATAANTGDIDVYSYAGLATGVYAYSLNGDASVSNDGSLYVRSNYDIADGMFASGADVTASNGENGDITAIGYTWAAGIEVSGSNSADVANAGYAVGVAQYGYDGTASGIWAHGGEGGVTIENSGVAYGVAPNGGTANGIYASASGGDISIVNDYVAAAMVDPDGGYAYATGINAVGSYDGADVTIANNGGVYAQVQDGFGFATGISATATGNVDITNAGTITVGANYGVSAGIHAESTYPGGDVAVANSGAIYADGYYGGTGIEATAIGAGGSASATNSEYIHAGQAYIVGYGAYGMVASGDLNATVDNSGTIDAQSGGAATGAAALAFNGQATATNSGDIHVYGMGYDYAAADGLVASSSNGAAVVDNSGDIEVASLYYGHGISASGTTDSTVTNSGDILSDAWNSYGILATAGTGDAIVTNTADGTVSSIYTPAYYSATVFGIVGLSTAGDVAIRNDGTVYAAAIGRGFGLAGVASAGNAGIVNTGSVEVATYGNDAIGALVRADDGTATFENSGEMNVDAVYGTAYGVQAFGAGVEATNTGSIDVDGYNAIGMYAVGADVSVNNDGDIHAVIDDGTAIGIYGSGYVDADATDGNVSVATGAGSRIEASSGSGSAYGIRAYSGAGDIDIASAGAIDANAYYRAAGVYATSNGDITISSTGDVTVGGTAGAAGLYAASAYGTITASNGGSLAVRSDDQAFGISVTAGDGAISVANAEGGSIDVESAGNEAAGIYARSYTADVGVVNAGAIEARAHSAPGIGIMAQSVYGDVSVDNSGSIYATSEGIFAFGITAQGDTAKVVNSGDISVTGETGIPILFTAGVFATGETLASFDNSGDISVDSAYASYGAMVMSKYGDVAATNSGDLSASTGYGAATGIGARGASVLVSNAGSAMATATDGYAYGIMASGDDVEVDNAGHAGADASDMAVGISAYGTASVAVANSGTIHAVSGADGEAFGVLIAGPGDATVTNSGTITASHPDSAVAVQFDSTGTATLANSGTIGLDTASEGAIIASIADGAGALEISNTGTMTGAIVTYAGDDRLANGQGGVWNVTNHATDFGAGDDAISNAAGGTIALKNGAIHLGSSTEAGNSFVNAGTLGVSGESLVDMGTGVAIAPTGVISAMSFSPMAAPNPAAFMNDGIIDFVDGSPGDILTIAGDFGGVGAVNLDVNLVNGTSDLLYIDGDVIDGTQQTVNLAVDDIGSVTDPVPAQFLSVAGSVPDGAILPGEVIGFGADNFLDLKVNVTQAADGGATVFSIDTKVAGLNQVGVLAANVAPGAQTLIASAIGTMRQRAGAQASASDYGMGPWVRFFDNSGDIDPAHTQDFGTAGDFRFEQMNRGLEFGMGFDFDGPVGFGVLLGDADAKQQMKDGSGSDHLEMSSVGVYGTWTMPAFYVDLSFRWMDFDTTLMSAAGESRGSGNATASNIEAGYTGWNMGGFDIVPQLQYTQSTVDVDAMHGSVASFENGRNDSSRGRLGVEISRSFDAAGLSWKPYAAASVVREFDGEGSYTIADTFSGTTSIEGTSTLLEAGIGTRIGGLSGTFGVNWSDGGALDSQLGGNLVLRYSW